MGKRTVSAEFQAIRLKIYQNWTFPQNFHTSILGKITVFYAVDLRGPIYNYAVF